ncbi:unnamed protein product [Mytilus coruscus]|uniref:PDZ domain-containing protein n=1 Tax=Mytilus coruscus TaxID=42192 RepID=A0A6J8E261_MYTCO|nr:unnamed protein product [Mytilus coruscus]
MRKGKIVTATTARFGFTLQNDSCTNRFYTYHIEENSPAAAAGLQHRDVLIEVNGENIENSSSQYVSSKIKNSVQGVQLLVLDSVSSDYFKRTGIDVHSKMRNVENVTPTTPFNKKDGFCDEIAIEYWACCFCFVVCALGLAGVFIVAPIHVPIVTRDCSGQVEYEFRL